MTHVTNIFWSSGAYVNGSLIYILYSDNTYDAIRLKHHSMESNEDGISFKSFVNAKTLRNKKLNKLDAIEYLNNKDKEFKTQ